MIKNDTLGGVIFFMKKIISYMLIFVIIFNIVAPHQCVYAEQGGEDGYLDDIVLDIFWRCAEQIGAVCDAASGDINNAVQRAYNAVLNTDTGYYEWLNSQIDLQQNGSVTISEEMYNVLLQAINELKTNTVNISDYIFKYYPDKELSSSRLPVATPSYDYIMNQTGSEGKAVMDNLTKHKYYWIAYATGDMYNESLDKTTDSGGNVVGGARYAYIDTAYENEVIFIKSENRYNMKPFLYDKKYQTFSYCPMNFYFYSYADPKTGYAQGRELNKYHHVEGNLSYAQDYMSDSTTYYMGNVNWGCYFIYSGSASSEFETTGTPFNYYGTQRFPIWVSQEKYVEYMTLFPNYNPETYITNNEDNSVTINNFYYSEGGGGDDNPSTDYSSFFEKIWEELSAFRIAFNSFLDLYDTKIEQDATWFKRIWDRQWTIFEEIEKIYNKVQNGGGSATDLEEVIKYLKKIDNKLLYNNVVETIDTIGTWLDTFLGGNDDETSLAKAALEEAMQSRFPFSLVFTFQALVNILKAEPIEPVFEFPFKMEMFNIDTTITLDFTIFEPLVEILHWFIILGFVYKLMMLTPKFLNIGGETT